MMVTFVSQCEKKALARTRRVLDAFADRIGDNTWQTVITQEGLLAVKKLLRKTATKNTAVSCHWIRSRSRSELVWVVGSKDKFNTNGVVPVNSTQKEVPMDIARLKPIRGVAYANTHLQRLDQHLYAVGLVAEQLYKHFYPEDTTRQQLAFLSGCLHDIGKIDPKFQSWVTKEKNKTFEAEDGQHIDEASFSFEKHPRHNEVSLALFALIDSTDVAPFSNRQNKQRVNHAIYWHHAKPFRAKSGFETLSTIYKTLDKNLKGEAWSQVVEPSINLLEKVAKLDCEYRAISTSPISLCYTQQPDSEKVWDIDKNVPLYKEYEEHNDLQSYKKQVASNAVNNQLRACLITADRWVSSLSAEALTIAINDKSLDRFIEEQRQDANLQPESNLVGHIEGCLAKFPNDERGQQQANVAQKLAEDIDRVKVLAGAAGCGKTKIALEWAKLRGAQQLIWVCPRVQICQGLFTDLINSDKPYLPNATVELNTGEFKCTGSYQNTTDEADYFSGDVVITTIDQLLNSVISHSKADRLLNYLSAHVVFDEYHEYINMPAFSLLFAEMIASREGLPKGGNTLLVSATPHYHFLKNILGLDSDYDVVEMPSFNRCKYQFTFKTYDENIEDAVNPLFASQPENTIVISNTALTAQKSFVHNLHTENAILLHSKYKKSDKQYLFDRVYESFQKGGTQQFDILRSGPIVQASLNISCAHMVSEVCQAENNLQRLGRLDRFGENTEGVNIYTLAVPETLSNGNRQGRTARFLSSMNVLESAIAWLDYLREATKNGTTVFTLPQLYQHYREFYSAPHVQERLNQDLLKAMLKSIQLIASKAAEPKIVIKPQKGQKQRAKISKNSLRGDTRFVQMAIVDVDRFPQIEVKNEYAYEIPLNDHDPIDGLAEACDLIQGISNNQRDSDKDLLAFMHKKHHEIRGGKKAYKDFVRLQEAVDPEFPVFLSYTPNDLIPIGAERARHPESIYYGTCAKQPVGIVSLKKLINQKD